METILKLSPFLSTVIINPGFLYGSVVKNLPANQKMKVWSLGQEDPLQKEMATYSSILAWEIPWTEEPGGLQSMGLKKCQKGLSDSTKTGNY